MLKASSRCEAARTPAPWSRGRAREIWQQIIKPFLPDYMGYVFEDCARAHTWVSSGAARLPFEPTP